MSDSMRKEFDEWFGSTAILGENKRTIAEKAWMASRESLVIPQFRGYSFEGCQYYDADVVDDALSDLGLKEKP